MTVPLSKAIGLINKAPAVIINNSDQPLLYLEADREEEEFLKFSYSNEKGEIFEFSFVKKDNEEVYISEYGIVLTDSTGEKVEILTLHYKSHD